MTDSLLSLAFKIHGMDCVEEVTALKRELLPLVGKEDRLLFDILNGKLTILPGASDLSPSDVLQAVERAGLRGEIWESVTDRQVKISFFDSHKRTFATISSGVMGLSGFIAHIVISGGLSGALGSEGLGVADCVPLLAIGFYLIGILAGIWFVLSKAWRAAINFRPDMNLLMAIAVIGAALIGEWFEAATVAFLFSLSLLLESWSVGRARGAIANLLDLSPATVRIRAEDGSEREVSPDIVAIRETFIVRPAEKIPLDGRVVHGQSEVNQAPITGESMPVGKEIGDDVFAGTINGDGVLEIECTKKASDTTLANIIRTVGEAQSRRAPSEKWVEKFAKIYTPFVMASAAAVLIVPPLVGGGEWMDWLYRSLVLLVIACPCALVISTPVSVVAALAAAARNGVLVKGGQFIELPAHLKAVALDKTGTLTKGKPVVVNVYPLCGHGEAELLQRAAGLESHSNHPLALAIVGEAKRRNITVPTAHNLGIIQGKGATGQIDGKSYWLGSHRYLEERNQETPEVHKQIDIIQNSGQSVVVVGCESQVHGFITLADTLRPSARATLNDLRDLGVSHLVMLTGDNHGTAKEVAEEAGIDEFHAELLPADKVDAVESLVGQYSQVAMVGDGVNDAPAMGRASLGIAMGAAGSDAAIETADIALMSDDLTKLPWLIQHSRRTLGIIRQNITFSLTIKALFVVLTFAGYASLWAAIAADMGASLLVIFNGLRLIR